MFSIFHIFKNIFLYFENFGEDKAKSEIFLNTQQQQTAISVDIYETLYKKKRLYIYIKEMFYKYLKN